MRADFRSARSRKHFDSFVEEEVMSGVEEKIRHRAYELWERSGKAGGSEMDFWLQAEREIAAETSPELPQDRLE